MASTGIPYPRLHGHEAIPRILAIKKTFRVILMTSLLTQDRKAYQLGMDHIPFLQKPFSVETMEQLVHPVLAAPPLSYDDSAAKSNAKQGIQWYG